MASDDEDGPETGEGGDTNIVKDSPDAITDLNAEGDITITQNITQLGIPPEKHAEALAEINRLKERMAEHLEDAIIPLSSHQSFDEIPIGNLSSIRSSEQLGSALAALEIADKLIASGVELNQSEEDKLGIAERLVDYDADDRINEQSVLFIGIGHEGGNTLTRFNHINGSCDCPTLLISRNNQLVDSHNYDSLHISTENQLPDISKYTSNQELIIISACYLKHNRNNEQIIADINYISSIIKQCKKSGAIVLLICTESVFIGGDISTPQKELIKTIQENLIDISDSTIFINQNNLLHYVPNLPIDESYSLHDQIICEIIIDIVESTSKSTDSMRTVTLNLEFSDLLHFLSNSSKPLKWFYGESDRGPEEVLIEALNHPLADSFPDSDEDSSDNITSMLALITGGPYLSMGDAFSLLSEINKKSPNSTLFYSIMQHQLFDETLKLSLFIARMSEPSTVAPKRGDRIAPPTTWIPPPLPDGPEVDIARGWEGIRYPYRSQRRAKR